jgi:hypothetical protein
MSAAAIKTEVRLFVLEHLVCDLLTKYYELRGSTRSEVQSAHQRMIENLRATTIPGLDAALSDLVAAEIQETVSDLLATQERMMGFS